MPDALSLIGRLCHASKVDSTFLSAALGCDANTTPRQMWRAPPPQEQACPRNFPTILQTHAQGVAVLAIAARSSMTTTIKTARIVTRGANPGFLFSRRQQKKGDATWSAPPFSFPFVLVGISGQLASEWSTRQDRSRLNSGACAQRPR